MKKKISRRQVVLGLGVLGAGVVVSIPFAGRELEPSPYPSCILTPEQTEGPYYFKTDLIRRDITEGQPGTPLLLKLRIVGAEDCEAIQDAVVDIYGNYIPKCPDK